MRVVDVVDESLVDATEVLVEATVQRISVAEQQLGGGRIGFEEFERRAQGGAKWRLGVAESCAALGQRDRNVGAQRILLSGDQLVEQVVLRVEIPVHRAVGQLRFVGDLGDRGGVKSVAGKDFFRGGHDLVTPPHLVLCTDRRTPARAGPVSHRSTNSSRRPTTSMNSETISSTTDPAGWTLFSEPTTWPTK